MASAPQDINSKSQPFYISLSENPPTPGFYELLENYSQILRGDIDKHLETVRDLAWKHYPYPSIGLFVFHNLGLSGDDLPYQSGTPKSQPSSTNKRTSFSNPGRRYSASTTRLIDSAYVKILQKLKNGGIFLDVGCMFAQDCRKLVHDGAPPENVYGTDIHSDYFDLGYALFCDEEIIPRDHFIKADIFDTSNPGLKSLEGKLDVINSAHVLHVFSLKDQKRLVQRFIKMLKPDKGVMITGRVTGHLKSGYHIASNAKATTSSQSNEIWEHNSESLRTLFEETGQEMGEIWNVECWFWRFGVHTKVEGKEDWHRNAEHGIVTFIATRL